MAQHDYVIANGTGAAVRSDLNNALAAIVSTNAGATEPTTTYAHMLWADTTANQLKLRNAANNAWIVLRDLDGDLVLGDGSAATPSLQFSTSGTDTGLYSPGADQVAVSTGGTSRLALSTTAISAALPIDLPLGTVSAPSLTFTGDLNTGIFSPTADTIAFVEGGSEAMRIDSSSRVLVGTSSTSANSRVVIQGSSSDGSADALVWLARGSSAVADGANLGQLIYTDSNHSGIAARITAARDGGTWTSGSSMPTRLVFSTTADSAASPTERMRIRNDGEVLFGTTTSTAGAGGVAVQTNLADGGNVFPRMSFNSSSTSADLVSFKYSGTQVGRINVTNTATSYVTSSDYRLKENVTEIVGAIDRINQLKPCRFNFIVDSDKTVDGFLAHEAQDVVPEAVFGQKDAVDDNGNPIYQGIDQSKLVPLLTAALQEALAKIETLEARLAAAGI